MLTMNEDGDTVLSAIRAGASGYLLKGSGAEEVHNAVRAAAAGGMVFGATLAGKVAAYFTGATPKREETFPDLTDRERWVLETLAAGKSNDAIASAMYVSNRTGAQHGLGDLRRAARGPPGRGDRQGTGGGLRARLRAGHNEGMSNSKAARAKEINESIRYTMWSVFRLAAPLGDADRGVEAAEVEKLFAELAESDVVVRGVYDVSGLRADADVMVWWHAADSEDLQKAYHRFRRTAFGRRLEPVWSQLALHRPAEFNKSHVPAFLNDEEPKAHICVYPFVRSYEWYLLPDEERRRMLAEHGKMARDYPDVRANTVASFALGDYEWILAFEGDELHRIVDLMRHLRASDARRHVREEVPFYTGSLAPIAELVDRLP